jgi:hypothetical protein
VPGCSPTPQRERERERRREERWRHTRGKSGGREEPPRQDAHPHWRERGREERWRHARERKAKAGRHEREREGSTWFMCLEKDESTQSWPNFLSIINKHSDL